MHEFKILEERKNPLFNRREISVEVEANITPNKKETEKLISEKFSIPIENIKIKKISGKFGSRNFTITANIYASKEEKDKIEPKEKKDKKVENQTKKESPTHQTLDSSINKENSSPRGEANESEPKASD